MKHGYNLPPGEEQVLARLSKRWSDRVPDVLTTWTGAVAMAPLQGRELKEADPIDEWVSVAISLAEPQAGEALELEGWIGIGVRDRRPANWREALEQLLQSPVLGELGGPFLGELKALSSDFIERYQQAFESPAALVHQD
ncbi:MAG: hypothetical protein ACI8X5_002623 [Planctomycetota bacterium]